MILDLTVNYSMNQALSYHLLVLDILCVTYFLTSVTAWPAN